MGTRSRIVIRRSNKSNIHLWMHWDGYFSGQGDRLCSQLRNLLQKYSTISLQSMVDNMLIEDIYSNQNFSAEYFEDFMEGRTDYKNDPCEDVEYEYIVDFTKGFVIANAINFNQKFIVLFNSILEGFNTSSLEDLIEDI